MSDHKQKQNDKIIVEVDCDLEDLIPGFLDRRQQDLQQLGESLRIADFDSIYQQAHTMKGVGGGYGFDAITSISRKIQQAAEQQDKTKITEMLCELTDYLRRVEVVFVK